MEDVAKITIWVPDQQALKQILSSAKVQLDCGAPKQNNDGSFVITLYSTKAEAQKIKALPFRHEVDENYGAVLEERQREVSKTDRFEGGKIKPEGLGVKISG